ncbi:MAG: outer membrane lipoprotein carrier protein LolA [Bacteroidetes bacterium]|nr:MAG: outer membrane lipoprotein carrier protein LolA [Bacteroidota bacterium]TNF00239.1 MAG: outer membrane lipoprotein carrier protein LolA [Bacteroidota bacterium]
MKIYLTLLLSLIFGLQSFAQDEKAQPILDKLSAKMKSQNSFYVEFSANIKNSSLGTEENETGKGWVKGDKYYASFGENTIISNGVKTWTIVKEEKSVYETDADEDDEESINPKKLMTIWESGFKNKYGKETTLGSETVHVIYLYPKNAGAVEYHTIVLYISKTSNELKKVVMKMKDGTVMTYKLTKFEANPEISDSKFVFDVKKYPGYTVIRD